MIETIQDLKRCDVNSDLEDSVIEILTEQCEGMDEDEISDFISDIMQYGCESGMISDLVYYSDTCQFYHKHKKEIHKLVAEYMNEFGYKSFACMFADKWDSEDMFAEDELNQNLLAWFAFEEITRKLANVNRINY